MMKERDPILLYMSCQSCDGDALSDTDEDEDEDDNGGGGMDVSILCCCSCARIDSFSRCMECI